MVRLRPPHERDRLISLVQYGKVTPQDAEAEASARGWLPFETTPPAGDFNPMAAIHWPIVMAVAWIAWRDVELTREQCAEFRAQCTHWKFQKWRQPIRKGTALANRAGWFLERLDAPTAVRLCFEETWMRSHNETPPTREMSIREAEAALWHALAGGVLTAEGLDSNGKPVEIPSREWAFLKLFEEHQTDVLKYDPLDPSPAFKRVHFRRTDLLKVWPQASPTIRAERDCYVWLASQMEESPDHKPKSREQFWTEAKLKFPTLAKRQFVRAWERAIQKSGAISWSQAGRLSTKSNRRTNCN